MTMFKSSNVGIWYCDTSWYMSKHIHEHFTGYTVTHTVYIYIHIDVTMVMYWCFWKRLILHKKNVSEKNNKPLDFVVPN